MKDWIKKLIASYDKLFHDEPRKKRPTVYKFGGKRYIKIKRFRQKKK